jgi:preprotein translocase subunit SecG
VVDLILFLALVLISIGLMAAVLMQSRGSGLGAAFGGDSSSYRSRRGVEARLYQFTIVLAVIFVLLSMLIYIVSLG